MMDLDDLERAMLRGARRELSPTASDRMRIQSSLVGTAAWPRHDAGEPPTGGAESDAKLDEPRSATSARDRGRGFLARDGYGLAAGLLIGGALGFGLGRHLGDADQRTEPALSAGAQIQAASPADRPALRSFRIAEHDTAAAAEPSGSGSSRGGQTAAGEDGATAAGAATEPPVLPDSSSGGPQTSASARSAAHSPTRPPARQARREQPARKTQGSPSTLAAELALLKRARRALNHHNGRLALGILQTLDEQFAHGVLMEERSATRILALCQQGRDEEARRQGESFLARHPRSVYAERVENSCAGKR